MGRQAQVNVSVTHLEVSFLSQYVSECDQREKVFGAHHFLANIVYTCMVLLVEEHCMEEDCLLSRQHQRRG